MRADPIERDTGEDEGWLNRAPSVFRWGRRGEGAEGRRRSKVVPNAARASQGAAVIGMQRRNRLAE